MWPGPTPPEPIFTGGTVPEEDDVFVVLTGEEPGSPHGAICFTPQQAATAIANAMSAGSAGQLLVTWAKSGESLTAMPVDFGDLSRGAGVGRTIGLNGCTCGKEDCACGSGCQEEVERQATDPEGEAVKATRAANGLPPESDPSVTKANPEKPAGAHAKGTGV